jgi:hypothetical protein
MPPTGTLASIMICFDADFEPIASIAYAHPMRLAMRALAACHSLLSAAVQ